MGGAKVIPMPEHVNSFLSAYEVIVVATHLRGFFYPKPPHQKWVLCQHSWDLGEPERTLHTAIEAVVALSDLHKRHIIEQGIPANKISVISNGVDPGIFEAGPENRSPTSLMFAGAFVKCKGIHILLEAFQLIRERHSDAQLHLYGSAAMWHDSDEYEQSLLRNAPPGVHFHGPVDIAKMPRLFQKHSIVCIPSDIESFSLVSIEAQACGCIPVAHDAGGIAATMKPGETGFLYSPNTVKNLAETILLAIEKVSRDAEMRRQAVKFAGNQFHIEQSVQHLEALLSTLVSARRLPGGINDTGDTRLKNPERATGQGHTPTPENPPEPEALVLVDIQPALEAIAPECTLIQHILQGAAGSGPKTLAGALTGNQSDELEAFLEKRLESPSLNRETALVLGHLHFVRGRIGQAARVYSHQARNTPDDPEINFQLGLCFSTLGDPGTAKNFLKRAIRHRPGHFNAIVLLDRIDAEGIRSGG